MYANLTFCPDYRVRRRKWFHRTIVQVQDRNATMERKNFARVFILIRCIDATPNFRNLLTQERKQELTWSSCCFDTLEKLILLEVVTYRQRHHRDRQVFPFELLFVAIVAVTIDATVIIIFRFSFTFHFGTSEIVPMQTDAYSVESNTCSKSISESYGIIILICCLGSCFAVTGSCFSKTVSGV